MEPSPSAELKVGASTSSEGAGGVAGGGVTGVMSSSDTDSVGGRPDTVLYTEDVEDSSESVTRREDSSETSVPMGPSGAGTGSDRGRMVQPESSLSDGVLLQPDPFLVVSEGAPFEDDEEAGIFREGMPSPQLGKPKVFSRARYTSDPRGLIRGPAKATTYKSVKEAQQETARKEAEVMATPPEMPVASGFLPWDKDLEMISSYQDKKEGLSESYEQYLKENPELWALLADFLQSLLIQKPDNVFQFAQDFFGPFDPLAPHQPSHPTTLPDQDSGLVFAPGFFRTDKTT